MKEMTNQEITSAEFARSYELYSSLFAGINSEFPQHQGFFEEEFKRALHNPSVIKTTIQSLGETCLLPQMEPISSFEWLNEDYYQNRYPDEYEKGQLFHFTDIPGIEPGEAVKGALLNLAAEKGVVVFDYPSVDRTYPERVTTILDDVGITYEEIELLGTQTYHAGQVYLKRVTPFDKPLDTIEAFKRLDSTGEFDAASYVNGASVHEEVVGEEANNMYRVYEKAYETLNDHPCKQGVDANEFLDMVSNDRTIAKVVYAENNQIATLCLITTDLGKLTWVNSDYYKDNFANKYEKGQVTWFPAIATDPERTGERNAAKIIELLTQLAEVGGNDYVVVFDTPDKNAFLADYLGYLINSSDEAGIDFTVLGAQQYCAVQLGRR